MENAEEFNEWHEDDLSFHKDTMVSFSQCTPDRNMSWTEILRFTSDNAGEDFTKRGSVRDSITRNVHFLPFLVTELLIPEKSLNFFHILSKYAIAFAKKHL